jgi:hypothetical protein
LDFFNRSIFTPIVGVEARAMCQAHQRHKVREEY